MSNFNPDVKYAHSKGVDLPIMYIYLAGRIAGNCIEKCLEWRKKLVNYYSNYKGRGAYPISFLDALNSKESDSVDKLGLTSSIPPGLIYDKDMLSIKKADVIVANMEDFMEVGIEDLLKIKEWQPATYREDYIIFGNSVNYKEAFFKLQESINNRRPNYGTNSEVFTAIKEGKPTILIAGSKTRKHILETHPFMRRASVIVENVDELIEKKWLNIIYKSISGATYE